MTSDDSDRFLPDDLATALAMAGRSTRASSRRRVLWYRRGRLDQRRRRRAGRARRSRKARVVVADAQSAAAAGTAAPGRRRRARLYMSTVTAARRRTRCALLTLAAGVAVAEGIQAATGLQPQLKWPNDVYIGRARKLAGILAEAGTSSAGVQYVVARDRHQPDAGGLSARRRRARDVDRGRARPADRSRPAAGRVSGGARTRAIASCSRRRARR